MTLGSLSLPWKSCLHTQTLRAFLAGYCHGFLNGWPPELARTHPLTPVPAPSPFLGLSFGNTFFLPVRLLLSAQEEGLLSRGALFIAGLSEASLR